MDLDGGDFDLDVGHLFQLVIAHPFRPNIQVNQFQVHDQMIHPVDCNPKVHEMVFRTDYLLVITRTDRKSQVRQCLGFFGADF